jgi:hypothetical protein
VTRSRPPALLLLSAAAPAPPHAPPAGASLCHGCSHLQGTNEDGTARCSAFARVPAAIWAGRADHRRPVAGDRGVTFSALGEYGRGVELAFDAVRAAGAAAAGAAAEDAVIETEEENRPQQLERQPPPMPDAPPETFHAVLIVEGVPTGDRRLFERGGGSVAPLPIPFAWQDRDLPYHMEAQTVAWVTRVEWQGDELHGWGYHDEGGDAGAEFYRQLQAGRRLGVSADADDADIEIDWPEPEEGEDEDLVMFFGEPDLVRFTRYRVRSATSVRMPAFTECFVEPVDLAAEEADDEAAAMVAAAAPLRPPVEWFADPGLPGPTALSVADDGRISGHLAIWGTCHTSFQDTCVTPPNSASGYAHFLTGELACADGTRVAVGQITMGTGHAGLELSGAAAARHYDDTGTAVADVTVGEDAHGIWVAGGLRPGVPPLSVRGLRAAALSGDWRRLGGQLELVAALAVNVPGFPVPRTAARVASGGQLTLVASGVVAPCDRRRRPPRAGLDRIAERMARSIGRDRPARAAALAARVHAAG